MLGRWTAALTLVLLLTLGIGMPAHAQVSDAVRLENYLVLTTTYVESCLWIDDLLRRTCARIGSHLSEANRKKCDLPDRSFRERIARSYPAFKDRYRDQLKAIQPRIDRTLRSTQQDLDQQFAEVRAGRVSMVDLDALGRELGDRCVTMEKEWLAPTQVPR